jgi:hypothetical protein
VACVAAGFLREDLRAGGVRAGERRAGGEKGEVHSRTQSPSYARCDEGLWPNPKPDTIKTW